jgi:hypothetical protein
VTRNKLDHSRPAFRVCIGTKKTGRLVNSKVNGFVTLEWLTIDEDFRFVSVDLGPDLCDDGAVDLNTPFGDEFVHVSSRTKA